MILIVDSGSTKADWCYIGDNGKSQIARTEGINPVYTGVAEIQKTISQLFIHNMKYTDIDSLFFYGAGCGLEKGKRIVFESLSMFFTNANIHVDSDMMGACKALFGDTPGIAAILGTGAGSCYYNGGEMKKVVPGLGFALGDEGSGAYLGKQLLVAYLRNKLPVYLAKRFESTYDLNGIIHRVYNAQYSSRLLAKFAPFLSAEIQEPLIYQLVRTSFEDFFERFILVHKNAHSLKVGFVGSIAFHFKELLCQVAENEGIEHLHLLKTPIQNLMKHHCSVLK